MVDVNGLLCGAHIHAFLPNIATILGTLGTVLRGYYAGLNLANAFFSVPMDTESHQTCNLKPENYICWINEYMN